MKLHRLAALITVSTLLGACAPGKPDTNSSPQVDPLGSANVAVVNGERIPTSVFETYSLAATQKLPSELTPEQLQQLTEQIILLRLLATEAEASGLTNETSVAAELEYQRLQLLARAMTEHFRTDNEPSEAELRRAYEDNLPRFLNTQYKARHILVETEEEAASLIAELGEGADFAQLAREHSTGPTGPEGGDLGWFTADSMVAPFAEAVRNAEIGTPYPEPVQTQFGWHVILVEEVRDQQPPGLDAVRADLVVQVNRQKLQDYLASLREAAEVSN